MAAPLATAPAVEDPQSARWPLGKAIISAWSGHHAVAANSQRKLTRNSGADDAADL
jgi:hypothetical protein